MEKRFESDNITISEHGQSFWANKRFVGFRKTFYRENANSAGEILVGYYITFTGKIEIVEQFRKNKPVGRFLANDIVKIFKPLNCSLFGVVVSDTISISKQVR